MMCNPKYIHEDPPVRHMPSSFFPELLPLSLLTLVTESKYCMPIYLSTDANDIICQMLAVNPTRIVTMGGIRNQHCFEMSLPEYRQPSKEEIIDIEHV